jgi:hypothetical protein
MRSHLAANEEMRFMTDVANALQAVNALISERTKYEGWVSALAKKTDVPAHVLEKVRSDYTGRLSGVLQSFATHVPSLQAALSDFQARDGSLAAQEKACRDEHAEGELRHMVGEFDSQQWDQVRIGHEALLSRLSSERQGIAAELSEVQRSLAAASDASDRARSIDGSAPTVAAMAPSRDDAPTPAVQAVMAEERVQPTASASLPAAEPPAPERAAAPSSPQDAADRRSIDDLGFLRGSARPAPARESAADTQTATATVTRSPETPMLRIVPDTPSAAQARSATPTGVAPDAAKTLRCAECGTMNYPTEWYCERCGGELAVL